MDSYHLRAILLKVQDHLSDDDRKRLHFFFGNNVPRRIRDDPSLGGTLNLLENLFEQEKINEKDFTFLINAFDEINCFDAVRILKEHMRKMHASGRNESLQSLTTILLQDQEEEDKCSRETYNLINVNRSFNYANNTTILNQNKINNVNVAPAPNAKNESESKGKRLLKPSTKILCLLLPCFAIAIIALAITTAFSLMKTHQLSAMLAARNSTCGVEHKREPIRHSDSTSTSSSPSISVKLQNANQIDISANGGGEAIQVRHSPSSSTEAALTTEKKEVNIERSDDTSTSSRPSAVVQNISMIPSRANLVEIRANAKWKRDGVTVAGGKNAGHGAEQLHQPLGLAVDDDQTVYVTEWINHRVVEWKRNAAAGHIIAGGNGCGSDSHHLCNPRDVVVDKQTDSLVICDRNNRRVVRWPRQQGSAGETIVANIHCWGLAMDHNGSIYVSDEQKHVVTRYERGASQGTVVAGGNSGGSALHQLNIPTGVFVDHDQTVYVAEIGNNRVTKWVKGAKEASIVAGGHGKGNNANQLSAPEGIVVDQMGTVYVADTKNERVMRWSKDATEGSIVAGGNSRGEHANQLSGPVGLSFDYYGNLYVAELGNHRVQQFTLEKTFSVRYHQTYELFHVASNKSLEIVFDGTNYGPGVQLADSHGGENQRWLIYQYVGGSIQFFNEKIQQALDVSNGRTEDGSGLQVHPNNMSGAQRWFLEPVGGDVYELIGVSSGKALSVGKSETSDDMKVEIRTRDRSVAQKWRFIHHSA